MNGLAEKVLKADSRATRLPDGLRILMIIGQYHPIVGGAERQAKKLSERLLALGHRVEVLTIHTWGLRIRENVDGIPVRRIAFYSFGGLKLVLSRIIVFLFVLLRGRSYSCVHVHGGNDLAVAAVLACRLNGSPTIVKMVNSSDWFDLSMMARKSAAWGHCARMLARSVTRFVATTPQIAEELRGFGVEEERISLIPNGTELGRAVRDRRSDGGPLALVMVGRLVKEKNASFLLEALSRASFPFSLTLYGDGPDRRKLEALIAERGLQRLVTLAGNVGTEVLTGALHAADVFVLPSTVEGLSNALLEAMSAGVPALVTDIPSNRFVLGDALADGCCLPLVEALWLEGLARLHADPAARRAQGDAVRRRVERFGLEKVAESYLELYREIADAP